MSFWHSSNTVLNNFDANADAALDLNEFRAMCSELFGDEIRAVENADSKLSDIFNIFDIDADGLLKDLEWER